MEDTIAKEKNRRSFFEDLVGENTYILAFQGKNTNGAYVQISWIEKNDRGENILRDIELPYNIIAISHQESRTVLFHDVNTTIEYNNRGLVVLKESKPEKVIDFENHEVYDDPKDCEKKYGELFPPSTCKKSKWR